MRSTPWLLVIALAGCSSYSSPCSVGPDVPILTPLGVATSLRRSADGAVVTSQAATTTTSPQRTVTITELDAAGTPRAMRSFDVGSTSLAVADDVESTGEGLAIVRALAMPSPDFGSVARSLELEIAGPTGTLLAPRTLPFADCTDCPPRTPALRFLGGHLVLLYAGASTTDTVFAILGLDGTILANGPLPGLTPGAVSRFKTDGHADALVLETPAGLEIVDASLTVLASLPAPAGSAIDWDLARGVAQLAWIDSEAMLTSSLLTEQLDFDGAVAQPPARISEALAVDAIAARDGLAVFGFVDDRGYLATARAGTKLGGDVPADASTGALFVPDPDGFAELTNTGITIQRRVIGCAP